MLDYQRFQLFDEGVYCFGDLNHDCIVGTADLLIVLSNFGCEFCSDGDVNLDYTVTTGDLMLLLNVYGQDCGCDDPAPLEVPNTAVKQTESMRELFRKSMER